MLVAGYLSLVLAAVVAPGPTEAETEPKAVEVEIDAPEGCSGAEEFWNILRSRTDRVRRATGSEPRTTIQVRLTRVRGQVVGELRMVDDRGGTDMRKMQGASCDEVVQALSLTAALALDPSALLSAPLPMSAPAEPATAPTADGPAAARLKPAEAVTPDLPGPVRRRAPAVEFGVAPVGITVLSGSFSLGAAVAARKTFDGDGAFLPTLGLDVAYVRNDLFRSPRDAQASLLAANTSVCPLRWSASILTVEPCALLLVGWLSATGAQVTHSDTADRLWLSAGGGVRIATLLGRGLSLEVQAGMTVPLLKRRFFTTVPNNVVAESPAISPMVGLGLMYGI